MPDQPPPLKRTRMALFVVYVVLGSISLLGAMLALSFLMLPEQG